MIIRLDTSFKTPTHNYQNEYHRSVADTSYKCICPHCKRHSLQDWGHYDRRITVHTGDDTCARTLSVKRVRCSGCHHTHAVFLFWMIPYCHISTLIIKDFLTNGGNTSFEESYIALKIRQFKQHWNERLISLGLTVRDSLKDIIEGSVISYHRQFMQIHCGSVYPFFVST